METEKIMRKWKGKLENRKKGEDGRKRDKEEMKKRKREWKRIQ